MRQKRLGQVVALALAALAAALVSGSSAARGSSGDSWCTRSMPTVVSTHAAAGSWSARVISSRDLLDVSFPTAERGWVVGKTGTILASSDAGQTWSPQSSGTSSDLAGVDFVDPSHGWAVGAGDTVVYTTDGGATWTPTTTGSGANLQGVDFVDESRGWAVGSTPLLVNVVVRTSDGGRTWTQQNALAGIGLLAVSFLDQQRGFIAGFEDVAYRTEDGGESWIAMAIDTTAVRSNKDSFHAVRRFTAAEGLAAGFFGDIYRTQDGGLTWTTAASLEKTISGLAVAGTSAFALGDQGLVARSEDSGRSWETEPSGTSRHLKGIAAPSSTSAFGVGDAGTLVEFKTTAPVPLPLEVGPLPESCQGLSIGWVDSAAGTQVAAATADLDRDGGLDVAVGGPAGLRALRPFVATEQSTVWRLPFQARFQQLAPAELDGNAATTELVGGTAASGISRSGVIAVRGATGAVLWSRQVTGGSRALRAADFNADGFADVVSIGDSETLSWLSGRDGSDLRPAQALNAFATDLELGRLNGDGTPDVVATLSDGKVVAFDGTTGSPLWTYQSEAGSTGGFGGLRAVALGDLTGDGIPDAVVVGEGTPSSLIPGNGDCSQTSVGTRRGALIAVVDGADGTRRWDYAEPGNAIFGAVSLGDLNRDGVLDVVAHASRIDNGHLVALDGRGKTANGVPTADGQTFWQVNTTRTGVSQAAVSAESIAVGDGSGDGTPDAYVGLANGSLIGVSGVVPAAGASTCAPVATGLWETQGTGSVYHAELLNLAGQALVLTMSVDNLVALLSGATGAVVWGYDGGGQPVVAIADLDGDGRSELGVGTASGRIYGLDGDGSALAANDNFLPRSVVGLAAADTDGDAPHELVGVAPDGTVRAVNPRTGADVWEEKLTVPATAVAAGAGVVAVGAADGRVFGLDIRTGSEQWQSTGPARINVLAFVPGAELFVAGDADGEGRILSSLGQVQPGFSTGTAALGGVHAIALADVDGDGTKELAVAAGGAFLVVRIDGSVLWRFDVAAGLAFVSTIAAVDLDGDGAEEVVGEVTDGNAYAFGGRTGSLLWFGPTGAPGGVAAMDVDGDGKQEALLGVESPGFPLGNGILKALGADGTVVSTCILRKSPHAIAVADYDGDGAPEAAVATGEGDVYLLEGSSPSAVVLTSFTARAGNGLVAVTWRTASESRILGFNLWRSRGGGLLKVNGRLIRAKASGRAGGAGYRVVDGGVRPGARYVYRLQVVNLDGTRSWRAKTSARVTH